MRPNTMRASIALAVFVSLLAPLSAGAQLGRLGDAARRAAEAARREAEEAARKKEKEKEAPPATTAPAAAAPAAAPATTPAAGGTAAGAAAPAPAFEAYSKYDFVPGERVVAIDDFSQDEVGDFPARWNTNASGEIVTLAGRSGRWLKLTRSGFFLPEFITELPDNFTLEFDFVVPPGFNAGFPLYASVVQLADLKSPAPWQSSANVLTVTAHPGPSSGTSQLITRQDSTSGPSNSAQSPQLAAGRNAPLHVAIWRQRQRIRVYMNEEKVWDVPRAIATSAQFNAVLFFIPGGCTNCDYYLANLRVATGAPDTRNKMLTQGKWVSHGILFDVNSDRLKGESYGSLKEIATVLTENADLKVQIVGHTDSDGDEKSNLDLSRRRAAAVKAALATQFAIDAGRMDTDGKGESEPTDKNDTPAGKANNRRVEFIRR